MSKKPETIKKMRKSKNVGANNSNFGNSWITNGYENKHIKSNENIEEGWRVGRTLNKLKNNTSDFIGVCFKKDEKRWFAYTTKKYRRVHLGMFFNENEAAKGYDIGILKIFGNLVRLNFEENREKYLKDEIFAINSQNIKIFYSK